MTGSLRELLAAATPGPWVAEEIEPGHPLRFFAVEHGQEVYERAWRVEATEELGNWESSAMREPTARLVALAPVLGQLVLDLAQALQRHHNRVPQPHMCGGITCSTCREAKLLARVDAIGKDERQT